MNIKNYYFWGKYYSDNEEKRKIAFDINEKIKKKKYFIYIVKNLNLGEIYKLKK